MTLTEKEKLLEIQDLTVSFDIEGERAVAVNQVSFDIFKGEVLGLVGESGCGKSVTSLSILRLIPNPPGQIDEGKIWFQGRNLLELTYDQLHEVRGSQISMIFQEPMTSLNPVFRIGSQVGEAIRTHTGCSKSEARAKALEMLERVGIPDAENRLRDYPHQFSGGMRQRAMIAMALALGPALLIADEPTTALDVTIQAQILELMLELKSQREGASILLITHDLGVVAETCDRVVVMYAGRLQEVSPVRELFKDPQHPYTQGLLTSLPQPDRRRVDRLETIPGVIPSLFNLPQGCKFCTRCSVMAQKRDEGDTDFVKQCEEVEPDLIETSEGRWVRCHLYGDAAPALGSEGDR